jgi:hypothetical protein
LIDRMLSGGGGNPSGPQVGGANPDPSAVAKAALPTITPGGDQGILQMLMQFLTAPGSPIGKLLNPDKGFGIAGPGGPGLPPPNLMGGLSGGGAPGTPPDPSQVRAIPGQSVVDVMRDPSRLASDAKAGFGGGGVPPGPGGAAMGSSEEIANAIRALTASGGDGVPADGDVVNPARAGAGGQFGRQPRTGGEYKTRKIKSGETLSGIAGGSGPKKLGGLRGANPSIGDPNKIRAGDTINVPVQNVTRAKGGGKKAIGSKQDIQRRAVSQAKEQSGYDRQKKKNKAQAKRQAPGNMYGVKGR